MSALLRVLAVDDEPPALAELCFLLGADPRVGEVAGCGSATEALRRLHDGPGAGGAGGTGSIDAVFLDVQMPGLSGIELAAVLARFRQPPAVVFVTAHDDHAVDAFELHAVDYVLKPVRADRLAEAVRRVVAAVAPTRTDDAQVAVELGGVTRLVRRADITHVEAQGDYARLHTAEGTHLLRTPLSTLEEEWADAGFTRIHRSSLVSLAHVREVRVDDGRCVVAVGPPPGTELVVARRHRRDLRERLRSTGPAGGS